MTFDSRLLSGIEVLAAVVEARSFVRAAEDFFNSGKLVELFRDWPDERFPLYTFDLSRHMPPAKVRAFLDLVVRSAADA